MSDDTLVTDRVLRRTVKVTRRRPDPPRELAFATETSLLTWVPPADTRAVTHFRLRIGSDSGAPAFQLPVGQTAVQLTRGITRVYLTSMNDTNGLESKPVFLDVSPGGVAPNVITATCVVAVSQRGSLPEVSFSGSITLPADCTHLGSIRVVLTSLGVPVTGAKRILAVLNGPFTDSGTVTYVSDSYSQNVVVETWKAEFFALNENGDVAPSPFTINPVTVPAAGSTVQPPTGGITVSGSDAGGRSIDDDQLTHTNINVVVTQTTFHGPQYATFWLSYDNGTNWTWIGWYQLTASPQTVTIDSLVPKSTTNWKAAVLMGSVGRTSTLPTGTVVSAGFSVAALSAPSSTGVNSFTVIGPSYSGINGIGSPYWSLQINGTVPLTLDANIWTYIVTVQGVNASGTADPGPSPNAGERDWFEFVNRSATLTSPLLLGNYNDPDSLYHHLRIRIYAVNRNATVVPGFLDPSAVLQACWPGGATFLIVNFGANPGGTLRLDDPDPDTIGTGLTVGTDGLKLNTDNLSNMLFNPGFEEGLDGWTQWGNGLVLDTAASYTGSNSVKNVGTAGNFFIYQKFMARPGDSFYSEMYYKSSGGATGLAWLVAHYLDASGSFIGQTIVTAPVNTSWNKFTMTFTAIAGTSFVRFFVGIDSGVTGTWNIDNALLVRQFTLSPELKFVSGQLGVNFAGSNLTINGSGGLDLGGVPLNLLNAGNIPPGVTYVGSIAANQILAGVLAAGVIYSGTINAGQINAGTINVASTGIVGLSVKYTLDSRRVDISVGLIDLYNSANVRTASLFGAINGDLALYDQSSGLIRSQLSAFGGYGRLDLYNGSTQLTHRLDASTGIMQCSGDLIIGTGGVGAPDFRGFSFAGVATGAYAGYVVIKVNGVAKKMQYFA